MIKKIDIVTNWILRIVTIVASIFTIPYILQNTGSEQYSMMIMIQALLPWFMLLDLGISSFLKNKISVYAKSTRLKRVVSSVNAFILFFVIFFTVVVAFFWGVISKYYLYKQNLPIEYFISFVLLFLLAFLDIYSKLLLSMFKATKVNVILIVATVFSLISIFSIKSNESYPYLFALIIPQVVARLILLYKFNVDFGIKVKHYKIFIFSDFKYVVLRSNSFFLYTLLSTFLIHLDVIFASRFFNSDILISYFLFLRLFQSAYLILSSSLHIYWPHFTVLYNKCAFNELRGNHFKLMRLYSALILIGSVVLYFLVKLLWQYSADLEFLNVITKSKLSYGVLIIVFCSLFLCRFIGDLLNVIFNSVGDSKLTAKIAFIQLSMTIPLQITFIKYFGVIGIPIAVVAVYLFFVFPILFFKYKKFFYH